MQLILHELSLSYKVIPVALLYFRDYHILVRAVLQVPYMYFCFNIKQGMPKKKFKISGRLPDLISGVNEARYLSAMYLFTPITGFPL